MALQNAMLLRARHHDTLVDGSGADLLPVRVRRLLDPSAARLSHRQLSARASIPPVHRLRGQLVRRASHWTYRLLAGDTSILDEDLPELLGRYLAAAIEHPGAGAAEVYHHARTARYGFALQDERGVCDEVSSTRVRQGFTALRRRLQGWTDRGLDDFVPARSTYGLGRPVDVVFDEGLPFGDRTPRR